MASVASRIINSGAVFWIVLLIAGAWMLHPLRQKLRFGIDLVGGTYVTLRVQVDKAVETELKDKYKEIESELKSQSKHVPNFKVNGNQLILSFDSYDSAFRTEQSLNDVLEGTVHNVSGSDIIIKLPSSRENDIKKIAVSSDIEVLRSRLNSIGVEEIKVAPQGERDIVVELPDVSDFNKAKEIIGKPANLEFKLVEMISPSKEEIKDRFGGLIPSGYEILPYTERGDSKVYVLVEDYAEVSGKHLKQVRPSVGQTARGIQEVIVEFQLTAPGAKKFGALTSENVGKQLAIVLDGRVISAPVINQAITGGQGHIQGNFTIESAKELATLLKSGAFVAPVTFEEERSVGPGLGYEAIKSGVVACGVGLILLLLFSLIVYKLCGLFAFLALLYNLFLTIFAMYVLGATLTLPGIAGMVLTIGMAIDSSILIFERIKELLHQGESIKAAINKGFKGALSVILDANITTFIIGVVLFYFGTGPVKGFAVTLMIGIIATLIAGLFFLRSMLSLFFNRSGLQKLSI